MAHQHNEAGYTVPFMKVHAGKYRTEDKVKNTDNTQTKHNPERLDWIEHGFTAAPTQYRLYGRRFLPARRYASAGNRHSNVSVCPSVCPSRAGIVSKRRKLAA